MTLRTILACCTLTLAVGTTKAQTYTEHLQNQQNGTGKVTVNQSKELEALINGSASTGKPSTNKPSTSKPSTSTSKPSTSTSKPSTNKPSTSTSASKPSTSSSSSSASKSSSASSDHHASTSESNREERRATTSSSRPRTNSESENKNIVRRERTTEKSNSETTSRTTDSRKKVMKGSRKVVGYRIQVYAGGNTRADREKAQQAGNRIKSHFPSYPIYVHFYSPSWKCRVGNFVEYKEAEQALRRIRSLGFKQAVIVKGKISVQ